MDNTNKRILILSIETWNERSGSDTLSSLFKTFNSTCLANIYIRPGLPDSNVCSRYLNISELLVMKSTVLRYIDPVTETKPICKNQVAQQTQADPTNMFKRRRIYLWARELGWKLGRWNSHKLNAFLDDFHPEVVVFPIEQYPYFNRISQYVVNRCKPTKVIGFLWDDNFTYKQHPRSCVFKFERYLLRKQIRKLVGNCTTILSISAKMKKECDAEFGINSVILTKPIFNQVAFREFTVHKPIRILYTGKLNIGREYTVIEVVKAIKQANSIEKRVFLDIYTATELEQSLRNQIEVQGCSEIHAPVPISEVALLQMNSDVLLFAESLSEDDLTARLSFSTKLTDYFAAGKCVWAVGNADLGPISYVSEENAGFVSTDIQSIYKVINTICETPSAIVSMAKNGHNCGVKNHCGEKIISKLKGIIYN